MDKEICLKYFDFIEIKYLIWLKILSQIFFYTALRAVSFEKSRLAEVSMQTGDLLSAVSSKDSIHLISLHHSYMVH